MIAFAAFGAFTLLDARQRTSSPPPFTAADRLEIQELLHRYMFVLDSCPDHNNGYEYADLYTEDGHVWTGNQGPRSAGPGGRTHVRRRLQRFRKRGAMNQVHVNVAPIIEPTPDGNARGISYLLMVDGPAHEIYWNGWYQDVYARTPKGWRFKSRSHVGGTRAGVPADLSAARALVGARAHAGRQPQPARESEAGCAAEDRRGSAQVAGERSAERVRITPEAVDSGRRSSCVSF